MFLHFFFCLRAQGIAVSPAQWLLFAEGLDRGLVRSFREFYDYCRCVLLRDEREYDNFDRIFSSFFSEITSDEEWEEACRKWLETPMEITDDTWNDQAFENAFLHYHDIEKMLEERKQEQTERHDGGTYWVGTAGASAFGHSGFGRHGIRVLGESTHKTALSVAGERNFRDFREDRILELRQYQTAFRKLRRFSHHTDPTEQLLDAKATVDATCQAGGQFRAVYQKPRKNDIDLLLLIDSGGSMAPYSHLCAALFQAVSKSNHFHALNIYYFHNCVYSKVFTQPQCRWGEWVETESLLHKKKETKVIFMGDASMAYDELMQPNRYPAGARDHITGICWLKRLKERFPHIVWLNPTEQTQSAYYYGNETRQIIAEEIPMYLFTLQGLEQAIETLLQRQA